MLIGDRRGRLQALGLYARLRQARLIDHDEVVQFVRARKLHGRGVGWIDMHLLVSVVVDRRRIWTADPRFAAVAAEIGFAHDDRAS